MSVPGFTDRYEAGALARARAAECDVPDAGSVIRVTFEPPAPTFHYDDDRPPYVLPELGEMERETRG